VDKNWFASGVFCYLIDTPLQTLWRQARGPGIKKVPSEYFQEQIYTTSLTTPSAEHVLT
jgi:hypothetical protein